MPLGHAGGDRAHAHLRHELHAHRGRGIGVFEVEDQLGEILDRIDVVVRRGADQADARRGMPRGGDHLVDLVAGELTPLARLRALGNLDLQFVGVGEIPARHTEAAGSHLLDGRPLRILVGLGSGLLLIEILEGVEHLVMLGLGPVVPLEPLRILAPFAGVALAAEHVHRDGEGFMSLGGDRAVAHRPGAKPLHDRAGRLDLVEGHRRATRLEREQPAEETLAVGVFVDELGKLSVGLAGAGPRGQLDLRDGVGIPGMGLPLLPPMKLAVVGQNWQRLNLAGGVAEFVATDSLLGNDVEAHAGNPAGRADEAGVDDVAIEADGLEDLGSLVGGERRDPHLAHHLEHALGDRLPEHRRDLVVGVLGLEEPVFAGLPEGLEGEIGIDGVGAVANEKAEVVHLAGLTRLDDDADPCPQLLPHESMVDSPGGEERTDRHAIGAGGPIGEHDQCEAIVDRLGGLGADPLDGGPQAGVALTPRVGDIDRLRLPAPMVEALDGGQLLVGEDRVGHAQPMALLRGGLEQIALRPDVAFQRHDHLFADRIDRRIGDLCKELLKVVGDEPRLV